MLRTAPLAIGVAALAMAVPSLAQAAGPPVVKTGLAGSLTPQSASVVGTVNANGVKTAYFFDYGLTAKYGARTPAQNAGAGETPVAATAGIAGLQPNTKYHYRLVARNAKGVARGANRSFKTPKQPLGFSVAAQPGTFVFGAITMVAGTLGGTGSANRAVQLQHQPWPFQAGFVPVGNVQLTDANGAFNFPIIGLGANTQYRVVTTGDKPVISPVVNANVQVRVTGHTRVRTVNRGSRLRFSGTVRPAHVGVQIGVQRRSSRGNWITVQGSRTRTGTADYARYATRVKIGSGGTYRVFVKTIDGRNQANYSPSIRIRSRR